MQDSEECSLAVGDDSDQEEESAPPQRRAIPEEEERQLAEIVVTKLIRLHDTHRQLASNARALRKLEDSFEELPDHVKRKLYWLKVERSHIPRAAAETLVAAYEMKLPINFPRWFIDYMKRAKR